MAKSYSGDLRVRVVEVVENGASRYEAGDCFDVSVSSAVRWVQRWHDTESCAANPRGGSISPLEQYAEQILALVAKQPDLTLDEAVAELLKLRFKPVRVRSRGFSSDTTSPIKKESAGRGTAPRRRRPGAPALDSRTRPA
jgi:putative transposase